jgi:hypothetical protein
MQGNFSQAVSNPAHPDLGDLVPGSRWRTRTRRHRGQVHKVVSLSADGRAVYVCAVGRGPRQHANKTYHVKVEAFLAGMEPLAGCLAR